MIMLYAYILAADFLNLILLVILCWFMYGWIVSARAGAPFVPTRKAYIRDLLAMADLGPDDIVYDLGCGDGRVLLSAVRDFRAGRAVGVDLSPLPLTIARIRLWLTGLHDRIALQKDDILTVDLKPATVIFTYLMPKMMVRLADNLATASSGTRIVSAAFPLPDQPEFIFIRKERIGLVYGFLYRRA